MTSTDAQGSWSYDFTPFIDIDKTSTGWAYQEDANANITWYRWFVPNPVLTAYPMSDYVQASSFKPGGEVTLSIGSLTWKAVADEDGWLYINTTGHDLVPGDVVVMTQGALSTNHTVIDLQVTEVDDVTDRVTGKAPANSVSTVWGYADDYYETTATADPAGTWVADFSGHLNLQPGTYGWVDQSDAEGDTTEIFWSVPDPYIVAYPQNDLVTVVDWPANTAVEVTIGTQTWDLTTGSGVWVELSLEGFDLKPDHHIVVSGGGITKEHTVFNLSITGIDDENDLVSGHGGANSSVSVFACDPRGNCYMVDANTDANGNWIADFSDSMHLMPGYTFEVDQQDADGDYTIFTLDYGSKIFLPLIQR